MRQAEAAVIYGDRSRGGGGGGVLAQDAPVPDVERIRTLGAVGLPCLLEDEAWRRVAAGPPDGQAAAYRPARVLLLRDCVGTVAQVLAFAQPLVLGPVLVYLLYFVCACMCYDIMSIFILLILIVIIIIYIYIYIYIQT